MKPPRKDDTLLRLRVASPKSDTEALRAVAHAVREALQTRAGMVSELGGQVEYEAQLARERIDSDGLDADLSAIRVGAYFKRMTEFNILQRVHRLIEAVVDGRPHDDKLNPDGDDG